VQELMLTEYGCRALIPQALAQPSMPRLRSLKITIGQGGGPSGHLFASLWAAPWLSQLQELSLSADQGFGSPGLAPLRAAPLLRKLSIQQFFGAPALTAANGRALAAATLPELRELRLASVEPGLVAALAAAPWLGHLESLTMSGAFDVPVGGALAAADGRALAAAPLQSLRRLVINGMERMLLAACAAAAWLSRLQHLEMGGDNGLLGGRDGLPDGASGWTATPFTALASLRLYYGGAAPPSEAPRLVALVAAPWFSCLHHLTLCSGPLGTAGGTDGTGLRALATAPLPNLTSLSLSDSSLSAADVSAVLSHAPWLASLKSLELSHHDLGAPGHRALSLLHLPRLRALSLDQNRIDGTGLAALVTAPWLTQLTKLKLTELEFPSRQSRASVVAAFEDDAWVFGRLRRLGCTVDVNINDDPPSDDELESGDEPLEEGDPGSDPGDG
jgi:hypothetical protein